MKPLELKVPPVAVVLLTAALQLVIAWGIADAAFEFPFRLAVAVVLLLVGLGCALGGVIAFRHAQTTVSPTNPGSASAVVDGGIYKFSRNPMYLGMLLLLTALAFTLSNWLCFATLPLFVAYLSRFQIAPEERVLAAKFGPAYDAYRQRVRRWL